MARLTNDELAAQLPELNGWTLEDNEIIKMFRFSTFPDAIAFVNRVADLAEDAGHHPDIVINYARVTLRLSTHDEGGITEMDVLLARKINALLGK